MVFLIFFSKKKSKNNYHIFFKQNSRKQNITYEGHWEEPIRSSKRIIKIRKYWLGVIR